MSKVKLSPKPSAPIEAPRANAEIPVLATNESVLSRETTERIKRELQPLYFCIVEDGHGPIELRDGCDNVERFRRHLAKETDAGETRIIGDDPVAFFETPIDVARATPGLIVFLEQSTPTKVAEARHANGTDVATRILASRTLAAEAEADRARQRAESAEKSAEERATRAVDHEIDGIRTREKDTLTALEAIRRELSSREANREAEIKARTAALTRKGLSAEDVRRLMEPRSKQRAAFGYDARRESELDSLASRYGV